MLPVVGVHRRLNGRAFKPPCQDRIDNLPCAIPAFYKIKFLQFFHRCLDTAGGTQANQSISLVPDDKAHGILVAGMVNGALMNAELRGYPYLADTHRMRFGGKKLTIPEEAYRKFLDEAKLCLEGNGITVTVVNQLPERARRRYRETGAHKSSDSAAFWVVLGLILLAGAGVAVYLIVTR